MYALLFPNKEAENQYFNSPKNACLLFSLFCIHNTCTACPIISWNHKNSSRLLEMTNEMCVAAYSVLLLVRSLFILLHSINHVRTAWLPCIPYVPSTVAALILSGPGPVSFLTSTLATPFAALLANPAPYSQLKSGCSPSFQ